mgnify:CR=1 FL=1
MSKSCTNEEIALLERARSYANHYIWALHLQKRRILTSEPEDSDFIFRHLADVRFFIVALRRLRRATETATKVNSVSKDLKIALAKFDQKLKFTKAWRDVEEHIDDYLTSNLERHLKDVKSAELQVFSMDTQNGEMEYLGKNLNIDEAFQEAVKLFEQLKSITSREFAVYRTQDELSHLE